MATPTIYKIYYKAEPNTSKLLGYLNNITQIIPGFTGENIISNASISLYDFTDTTKTNSYIYLTNAEYTQSLYVIGFWFSVSGPGNYTLLQILGPEYKITISNKILSDSIKSFSNGLSLTNTYNMCAMVFENDKLTKVVINDTEYPLLTPIQINTSTPTALNFSLGNDNNMATKLNGYIGEIQILNANSFTGGKFNTVDLYAKMKYKHTAATTTTEATTTAATTTAATTTAATTTAATTTEATTTAATTTEATTTEATTTEATTTAAQIVEPDANGFKISGSTTTTTTEYITLPVTTTEYIPATTLPPNLAQLPKIVLPPSI